MKKYISILLLILCILSLEACGKKVRIAETSETTLQATILEFR